MSVSRHPASAHESAVIDEGAVIGARSRVWHFSHVMGGARIGEDVNIGQGCFIGRTAVLGDRIKVQNNVSIYDGTTLEDEVFLGPSCVLTNVTNPRSQVNRRSLYEPTRIRRGASVGANATVVCGVTIGRYAFVGAGAVVTSDVPDYALVVGVPGRAVGWMSRHGHRLDLRVAGDVAACPESGLRYELDPTGVRCLDLDEEATLPEDLAVGEQDYRQIRARTDR